MYLSIYLKDTEDTASVDLYLYLRYISKVSSTTMEFRIRFWSHLNYQVHCNINQLNIILTIHEKTHQFEKTISHFYQNPPRHCTELLLGRRPNLKPLPDEREGRTYVAFSLRQVLDDFSPFVKFHIFSINAELNQILMDRSILVYQWLTKQSIS